MTAKQCVLVLLVVGVVLRIFLVSYYDPLIAPDSSTYVSAAHDLKDGNLTRSEGRRTPGYPLVLALVGDSPVNVMIVQACAGILISLLLFYVVYQLTSRPLLGLFAGLAYNLTLQQLFLEAAIITETTSTLTVIAVIAIVAKVVPMLRIGRCSRSLLLLLGIVAGMAILVRPQYIFLPALLALVIAYVTAGCRLSPAAVGNAALVALPGVLLVLAWCTVIYAKVGFFAMSTQSGFGLANHSIAFVEFAPDRYATIRDVLVRHRAERVAEVGHYRNAIWYAYPDLKKATGLSLPELSQEVQRMSVDLFKQHPIRYGLSVAEAWIDFWTVPLIWSPDNLKASWLERPLDLLWWVEHKLLRLANVIFLVVVLAVTFSHHARRRLRWGAELTFIAALVLCTSVVQALADQGASSRYAVTIQAALIAVVMICAWRYVRHTRLVIRGTDGTVRPQVEEATGMHGQ